MGAGLRRRGARRGGTHSPEGQLGSGNPMSQADTDATTRTTRYRRKPVQRKRPPETGDISRATSRINSICVDNRPIEAASAGRSRDGVFERLAFPWSLIGRDLLTAVRCPTPTPRLGAKRVRLLWCPGLPRNSRFEPRQGQQLDCLLGTSAGGAKTRNLQ